MRATRYSFALPRPKIAGAPATSLNISRFGNGRSLPAAPASDAIPPPMCTTVTWSPARDAVASAYPAPPENATTA